MQLHPSPCENWTEPHVWIHYPYRKENPMLRVPASQFVVVETLATTHRYWNLEGAHISAVMYPAYPTAMPAGQREINTKTCDGDTTGYIELHANSVRIFKYVRGSDHFLRLTLEEKLNARVVARYPKDENFVEGEELPNGQLTGALAEMASGQAQLGLNLRFVRPLPTPEILYLQPVCSFARVGIAVARAPLAPLHVAIMRSFDLKVWFSVAAFYILSAMIWSLLTSSINYKSVLQEIQKFLLIGCGSFAQSPSQKFFASACAIFSLIIVTIFQEKEKERKGEEEIRKELGKTNGSLVNVLTTPVYDRDINTANELLQSGLPIATNRTSLIHMFQLAAEGSPVMTELCKHMKPTDKHNLTELLFDRKQALIIADAGLAQLKNHHPSQEKMLHMIKDTFIVLQRAYAARTDCPVKEQVEKIIWCLTEAGIPRYWNTQASRSEFSNCPLPEDTPKPFSLKQFKIAFYTLCIGLLFSSFVFLLEIISYKRCQKHILK
uniref:Ionotropic receptor 9 n=1 Tax=Locusta migratoria TaxID=7004 RepID=A0A0K2D6R5_LOCMI|nr:ionotropic receptor 9 [Locusta migratoria]